MLCLKVIDREQKTVAVERGKEEVNLVVSRAYQEGDRICLEISEEEMYLWLQVDDAIGSSLIYVKGGAQYYIPFGEKRINLSPKAFAGEKHLLHVRKAKAYEIEAYRNLALNVNDQHENATFYPHVTANVETRGESVFAAKNAIDGITANHSHGEWPYASWGINRNPEAKMRMDFGRIVEVDRIILYLRADFPHDNWWTSANIEFSDGSNLELSLKKTDEGQEFVFEKKQISYLEISKLIKSEEKSPFPALTQIKVFGKDFSIDG